MARRRLLFMCQTLPYPPDGGVAIRSYNILRLLGRRYDVTALTFYRKATAVDIPSSIAALRQVVSVVEAFPIEQEYSVARRLRDHTLSTVRRRVYTVYAYWSAAYANRLRDLIRSERFDLVHVDSLDLSGYLPLLHNNAVICTHHNIESQLLMRRSIVEAHALRSRYLRMQAVLMAREERKWSRRVPLNVVVSPEDKAELQRLAPDARVTVVPNGVDIGKFQPVDAPSHGIVFVGGMTWFPNKDALDYFAGDILPLIRAAGCADRATWVGRALAGSTDTYRALGVTLTGYVEDIRPYVAAAACYVVPLRVGGGTRLKILDAWAMGKAVVSTSVGCEGLEARDGWNILIRDTPEQFANAVMRVLEDPRLRDHLGKNARLTAERTYSWEVIGEHMYAEYEAVRAASPEATA